MAIQYRTQGFVIKKTDRKESDRIFSVFTKDFGKIEVLGKGIRKINSKLKSNIDIFCLCDIEFIRGKSHKTLTDSCKINDFRNIRNDFEKSKVAFKISETLCGLVHEAEKDEKIWNLLIEIFDKLDSQKLEILHYYFLWNLLSILGYKIDLYNCILCKGKLLPDNLFFSSKEGGVAEKKCFDGESQEKEISPETIKILRIILKNDWQTIMKLKISPENMERLGVISQDYFSCHKKEEFAILS